jgi:hypothetical protein
MSDGLPRCACGFVMPGPIHGLDCKLYDPGRIYGTTIPPHKVALLYAIVIQLMRKLQADPAVRVDLSDLLARLEEK